MIFYNKGTYQLVTWKQLIKTWSKQKYNRQMEGSGSQEHCNDSFIKYDYCKGLV